MGATAWRDLIDQLLFEGLLREDPNEGRPLIDLGEAEQVKAVYRGERRIAVRHAPAAADDARPGRPRKRHGGERLGIEAADAPLFEALRAWRRDRAAEQHVPPYVIFHDATLSAIARERPGQLRGPGQGQRRRAEQAQALRRGCVEGGAGKYEGRPITISSK